MSKYESMTNDELNVALAETVMGVRYIKKPSEEKIKKGYIDYGMAPIGGAYIKWNPTEPDSNQIERYVFPKLLSAHKNITVDVSFWEGDYAVNVTRHNTRCYFVVAEKCKDPDQINKTKAIAVLKALEVMNG